MGEMRASRLLALTELILVAQLCVSPVRASEYDKSLYVYRHLREASAPESSGVGSLSAGGDALEAHGDRAAVASNILEPA
jgi:hypothetical protein